ncbi:uncharacterized protein [Aristolochia californica]|uniref:uncharacterized protein n=1 Tax=Aristolochia californica TaxID=171875 RepID=UPI0035D696D3
MGAMSIRYCFLLLAVVVAGITLSGEHVLAQDCSEDFKALTQHCARFVRISGPKEPPSAECCQVVQRCNLPCICSRITKEMEKIISPEKVAFVAHSCGRPIPSGTKCGSLTIPLA